MNKKILITGGAGFIGFHLVKSLLNLSYKVVIVDNLNDYYDVKLKLLRLSQLGLKSEKNFLKNRMYRSSKYSSKLFFYKTDITDSKFLNILFKKYRFEIVCNLAAQAGVRYSISNPHDYINSNIVGFLNIVECCKNFSVDKIVYASSSSVYGNHSNMPFNENLNVNKPISIYAASKITNELIANVYSHLYKIQMIGLRFFTVYGPYGRPDMAMFLFTKAILDGKPIDVYNKGNLYRDFTFIDDIIDGIKRVIEEKINTKNINRIYNIGNSNPIKLSKFVEEIELKLKRKAKKNMLGMQKGDVNQTWADIKKIKNDFGYKPKVSIKDGVSLFIDWYLKTYKLK